MIATHACPPRIEDSFQEKWMAINRVVSRFETHTFPTRFARDPNLLERCFRESRKYDETLEILTLDVGKCWEKSFHRLSLQKSLQRKREGVKS